MGVGTADVVRREERLARIGDRTAPLVLAGERRLDVSPALVHVLPEGLKRGSVVGVGGLAPMSLGLVVAAGPVASGSWLATLGCEDLNLVAAEQAGLELHQMVQVSQPPRAAWGGVAAALVDAFDVILMSSRHPVRTRDASRLTARARERGGLIIDIANSWPVAHDMVINIVDQQWVGLGEGHGALTARQVVIEISGRRGVRPRQVPMWLPGPQMVPEAVEPTTHAGADIDRLVCIDGDEETHSRASEHTVAPIPLRRVG